jgi:sugar phosphate permease
MQAPGVTFAPRPGTSRGAGGDSREAYLRGRLHYAWVVAGVTFLILMASAGIRATPSVLMVPLEQELGWSRTATSTAVSVGILLYGLIGPFCAAIAQRVGIRRTMAGAMSVLAVAVLLATRVREPWQLVLLWGFLVGTGTGMVATVMGAVVVNRWFARRRGLVLGALTASTATGQLLFLPVLARLVEHQGWRWALYLVGAAAFLTVPLALLLVREAPAAMGLAPYGAGAGEAPARVEAGNPALIAVRTLVRAARHRAFWLLAGTFFVCGASTNGLIGTHLIPACMDHGMPEVQAAGMLALMGVFDLFGTTGSGWLSDRWDCRKLLFTYYALRGLSLILLPHALVQQGSGLSIFTVFYGLDWIATVPPTVKLATDAFGREDAPIVFGWVMAAHQVGAGAAALAAGIVRARMGDYQTAFLASGALCLVAAVMALAIRSGRDRAGALAPGLASFQEP